jgi:hypothetical protein
MSGACGTTEVVPCYKAFRLVVVQAFSYPMSQRRGTKFVAGPAGLNAGPSTRPSDSLRMTARFPLDSLRMTSNFFGAQELMA